MTDFSTCKYTYILYIEHVISMWTWILYTCSCCALIQLFLLHNPFDFVTWKYSCILISKKNNIGISTTTKELALSSIFLLYTVHSPSFFHYRLQKKTVFPKTVKIRNRNGRPVFPKMEKNKETIKIVIPFIRPMFGCTSLDRCYNGTRWSVYEMLRTFYWTFVTQ